MDGCSVPDYGVDTGVYFAGDVKSYIGPRDVVYFGGGIVIFAGGDFLSVAQNEVFPCHLAFIRNWWDGVLFLCGAVWVHH